MPGAAIHSHMDISLLLRGLILGVSIAAPVGPIGLLCIKRTLVNGRVQGLVSGLGAATADGIYGLLGALGITVVSVTPVPRSSSRTAALRPTSACLLAL